MENTQSTNGPAMGLAVASCSAFALGAYLHRINRVQQACFSYGIGAGSLLGLSATQLSFSSHTSDVSEPNTPEPLDAVSLEENIEALKVVIAERVGLSADGYKDFVERNERAEKQKYVNGFPLALFVHDLSLVKFKNVLKKIHGEDFVSELSSRKPLQLWENRYFLKFLKFDDYEIRAWEEFYQNLNEALEAGRVTEGNNMPMHFFSRSKEYTVDDRLAEFVCKLFGEEVTIKFQTTHGERLSLSGGFGYFELKEGVDKEKTEAIQGVLSLLEFKGFFLRITPMSSVGVKSVPEKYICNIFAKVPLSSKQDKKYHPIGMSPLGLKEKIDSIKSGQRQSPQP